MSSQKTSSEFESILKSEYVSAERLWEWKTWTLFLLCVFGAFWPVLLCWGRLRLQESLIPAFSSGILETQMQLSGSCNKRGAAGHTGLSEVYYRSPNKSIALWFIYADPYIGMELRNSVGWIVLSSKLLLFLYLRLWFSVLHLEMLYSKQLSLKSSFARFI